MSALPPDSSRRTRSPLIVVLLVVIVCLLAAAFLMRARFELEPPKVAITPDAGALGPTPLELTVSDAGAGLKSVVVTLSMGGAERQVASEQFSPAVAEKKIPVSLGASLQGVKEGKAMLRVIARDNSLWNFFQGNEAVVEKELSIDFTPPTVELIADDRYVNFGGVGVVVYKSSEDTVTSGVKIGNYFFPGFKGQIKGHDDYAMALFAHAYNVPAEARAVLVATDKAGNTRELPLVYELKNVKYKKSTIALSENFLQKITPLLSDLGARQGAPKDVFVRINKGLRKENEDRITAITSKATPNMLWQGAFKQLSNSKVEANFADERTYTWDKEPVDTAFHLGYDLSVTRNYPVEAANSGKVAFAGDLGIYGNVVILDHGLGLFTLYGHLSSIDVKVGDSVERLQILGKTGETGMAAGDHLHYGVYLNGVAVLPVEWWDPKWIADNIEPKLAGMTGEAIAESQQPSGRARARAGAKAPAKAGASKRRATRR